MGKLITLVSIEFFLHIGSSTMRKMRYLLFCQIAIQKKNIYHKIIGTTYRFTNFSLGYLHNKLTLSHYSQKPFQNVEPLPVLRMGSN